MEQVVVVKIWITVVITVRLNAVNGQFVQLCYI